jgi:hypothetical protein
MTVEGGKSARKAKLVVRCGALPNQAENPGELIRDSLARSSAGWRVLTTRVVAPAPKFRRQANQFANDLKSAVKEVDVYAMLVPECLPQTNCLL